MKKLIVLFSLCVFFASSSAALAVTKFVHNDFPDTAALEDASPMLWAYKTSTNVVLFATTNDTNTAYGVASAHTQGTRMFFSGSGSALIEQEDLDPFVEATVSGKADEIAGVEGDTGEL